MSNFKGGRRNFRNFKQNKQNSSNKNETVPALDELNPIIAEFREISQELDDKYDRYERIVKLGRDITIESKRIIFLLHTIDPNKNNKKETLLQAEKRLQVLCDVNFKAIAKEIGDLSPYQYGKAYSAGLQEFVEAYSFYKYLNGVEVPDWEDLQKNLEYHEDETKQQEMEEDGTTQNDELLSAPKDEEKHSERKLKYTCLVQPVEFIAGLADVGGELMRRCINSLNSKDVEACFASCKVLQEMYAGYLAVDTVDNRDLSNKLHTFKQSMRKAENVCYNIKVRGVESAKWGSINTDVYSTETHYEDDEGFFS